MPGLAIVIVGLFGIACAKWCVHLGLVENDLLLELPFASPGSRHIGICFQLRGKTQANHWYCGRTEQDELPDRALTGHDGGSHATHRVADDNDVVEHGRFRKDCLRVVAKARVRIFTGKVDGYGRRSPSRKSFDEKDPGGAAVTKPVDQDEGG